MIHLAAQTVPQACSLATAKSTSSILDPIAKPIADVLAFFYAIVPNYAVAILLLSLVWMVLISPLTLKTTRSMLAMQKLQPELKRLQEKHRNDRQALTAAQMELYRTHNVSPFGSCLPSILPLPVFFALFRVIEQLSHTTPVHTASGTVVCPTPLYLSHSTSLYQAIVNGGGKLDAFGLDLAKSALSSHGSVAAALPYFALLLAMMATQYFQTQQMMSRNPAAQQNSQMAIMKYLPLVFGLICIRFPAGVVLYYAMSNLCRIVQQDLMYRFDPKVKALAIKDVVEIEETAGVKPDDQSSLFTKGRGNAPASGRMRFRDLLGNQLAQQGAPREEAKGGRAPGPAGAETKGTATKGTATKGTAPRTPAKAGTNGTRAGRPAGSGTARSGGQRQAGSGKPGGARQAEPGRPQGSGRAGGGSAAAAPPPSPEAPPNPSRRRRDAAPAPGGAGTEADQGPAPANGTPPQNPPRPPRPAQPKTGAGTTGRTGAGSGRTGAQQGPRGKRRGR